MDRVDGPYYLFKPLDKLRRLLPSWFPLVWRKTEPLNMVPVDYVAAAIDHIAHKEGLDGRTFHLVDPAPPPFEETFNLLSEAGAGPKIFKSVKPRLLSLFGGGELLEQLGSVRFLRAQFLRDWGIPPEVAEAMNRKVEFATKGTEAALEGSGVVCPRQEEYLEVLWDYYVRHLDPERKGTRPKRMQSTLEGKRILITGASSGVGAALARKCGQAGAHVLLVARREEELNNVAAEVREAGGQANTYVVDLSDWEACDRLIQEVDAAHDGIDILVNNAAHSIRRAIKDSVERFRDYERLIRLNYLAPVRLTLGFLPKMQAQGSGHLVNVLSAGTLFVTPRFSAYVASKAALHAFTDSFAAEFLADNLFATSVYLPLVRTPMITATDTYKDTAHVMTPEQAADWIIDGILQRKRRVLNGHSTRRFVLNILTPMAMTRILNVLFRIYAEEEDAYPELDIDRTIAKRFIKGKPF